VNGARDNLVVGRSSGNVIAAIVIFRLADANHHEFNPIIGIRSGYPSQRNRNKKGDRFAILHGSTVLVGDGLWMIDDGITC
jgi:hypothetical protein